MKPSSKGLDLLSIGDSTTDVFLQISDASVVCQLNKEDCLLCIEYADKIPVEHFTEILGVGNAANNAIGASRLGLKTALWTILGTDAAGDRTLKEVFRPEGVETRYIERDKKHGTNFSTVINFQKERTILVYHQPRTYRMPKPLPAQWTYLTSMGEGWEKIVPALKQYVTSSKTKLVFNPGTHQLRSPASTLDTVLSLTHVLVVNKDEARRITGMEQGEFTELIAALHRRGPRIVIVTDGPEGATASDGRETWFMPTVPAPVIERTGAGDSFATAVLAALFYGHDLPEALRWGAANSSSVIQFIGAREGLLTKSAIEKLLRKHRGVMAKKISAT